MSAVCVVGAGPRGTSVLERLCAWADDRPLEIHVVDPFPPGPGRIWRREQSDLLWMNSTVADVRMFTGPGTAKFGNAGAVPTFEEWLATDAPHELSGELAALAQRLSGRSFAPRPLVGEYYSWVFDRVIATAPGSVRVVVHRTRATDLADGPDGRQLVTLADGSRLAVDQVVLAQGNFEARATDEERDLSAFAERHGLRYFPSGYFDEARLRSVPAGEPVLLRGFGLTFIDCMALLCEGRGGRFEPDPDHGLRYLPCGREPVLFVGSRRGLPYRAKFGYQLEPPPLPRFFTAEAAGELGVPLEFERDLLPLLSKEVAAAYYHEFFRTNPDRVRRSWPDFSADLVDLDWGGREWDELVAASVPEERDRFSWNLLDRHLDTVAGEDLQAAIRDHIAEDLRHRGDPAFSPELAAVQGLLSAVGVLIELAESERLSARSLVVELENGFLPLLSFITSGPPPQRLAELLALSRAGVVRFLGPGTQVRAEDGVFRATGALASDVVEARCLVESRLRTPSLLDTDDDLLQRLFERGECVAQTHRDPDGSDHTTGKISVRAGDHRLLRADGTAHPTRFAIGPYVAGVHTGTSGPGASGFFAGSDLVARTALAVAPAPVSS
ncbi:FAD/NAD(P)-binding protein [Saccharopolyspora mangrovi]|uniref:FAD/NAD(P)-binding protein n=1 Tax=Saccharopolyspora mangrovi TaxID=3082379 RepID=A0ABU6AJ95_9PSEU|nr:FAD/NAD(P)-binding protein [Saccharopolyspora sp. S2-29]MEB3371622.1 FAD/NAD(P)-binding protein [Saccharopolyspora sp. S2-29]